MAEWISQVNKLRMDFSKYSLLTGLIVYKQSVFYEIWIKLNF